MDAVRTIGLGFTYPSSKFAALRDVSFTLAQGEFALVVGPTGSGKSTLLRLLKREVAPFGTQTGEISLFERGYGETSSGESASLIGFVMQDPSNQIVTDTVAHELAFGLENTGLPLGLMQRRVAETANFFGITSWFNREIHQLSEGQKQIVNLAAIVALRPQLIVLDEPTARLDPIARKNFLQLLTRVNKELGITVLISEHSLDDVAGEVDHVLLLNQGALAFDGTFQAYAHHVFEQGQSEQFPLPTPTLIASEYGVYAMPYPLTVRDARSAIDHLSVSEKPLPEPIPDRADADVPAKPQVAPKTRMTSSSVTVLAAHDVWFQYAKKSDFVLSGASIELHQGEIHALLGGNGSGKSTLLKVLSSVLRPRIGKITSAPGTRLSLLVQEPKALFTCDSVLDELMELSGNYGYSRADVDGWLARFNLVDVLMRHPYDLSGGEQQKVALAKLLLLQPTVIVLDEPTKGLDPQARKELGEILTDLQNSETSILLATHDLEFADTVADRCSLLFDGRIVCTEPTTTFFEGNLFYTTTRARIFSGISHEQ